MKSCYQPWFDMLTYVDVLKKRLSAAEWEIYHLKSDKHIEQYRASPPLQPNAAEGSVESLGEALQQLKVQTEQVSQISEQLVREGGHASEVMSRVKTQTEGAASVVEQHNKLMDDHGEQYLCLQ